jgi:transposase
MKKVRVLTTEEKEALILRVEAGEAILSVAKASGVLRKSLYEWRAAYQREGIAGLNRKRGPKPGKREVVKIVCGPEADLAAAQARIAELERLIGRQQADLDFFREALQSLDETRQLNGAPAYSRSSKK